MVYWIIVLFVWLVGMIPAWKVINKWDKSKAEKIYYTIIWPLMLPLFLVHWWHNLKD